ncbi:MAG: CRISPR-associated endonuclease Cas2 [Alphaproteobacteria bacterium]|nr:CRISPR-associated endonuclease Cas2 [Alphaproteobacteria bacterium]
MKYKKGENRDYLNGRKLMWMMVMFDLPTDTKAERKSASKFRNFLLNSGFSMVQFSVYVEFTGTLENSQKYINTIKKNIPEYGDINILFFTDKQFSSIIHIQNLEEKEMEKTPPQLELF